MYSFVLGLELLFRQKGEVLRNLLQPWPWRGRDRLGMDLSTKKVRLSSLLSPGCWIQFLFPVCAEDCDL